MKRVILICPDQRPGFESIAPGLPLVLVPFLGKPVIEHTLDGLVRQGVTHVRILASDRPSEVRAYVLNGTAWGLELEINPEPAELSIDEAAAKHAAFQADAVLLLDALPQAPGVKLFADAAAWHAARATLLPLLAPHQIGCREIAPGIWFGLKARAASTAQLHAPCWVGPHSMIRDHATVGPHSYVESDCLIDAHATVENSTVGPRTYVGNMTLLRDSVANGAALLNWKNGALTHFTDAFLLSPLDHPHESATSLPARLLALAVLILTSPVLLPAALLSLLKRQPFLTTHTAVLPHDPGLAQRVVTWQEIPSLPGVLRRWPTLWRIFTGHFAWTGNPPLTPEEATQLDGEFEQLWLHTAPGLFTAPEAEGCRPPWDDTARAHAALFACQPTASWRWKTIRHGLTSLH